MKKTLKILGIVVVVLALAFVALDLSLGKIVLKSANAAAPAALGVPVTLQDVDISLLRGTAAVKGLHVGNPEGFKTAGLFDLGAVSVDVDNSTLLSDVIVIKEISIDGLALTYEQGLRGSNLGALIDQLSAGQEEKTEDQKAPPEEKAPAEEKPGKKVVIEKLSITGSQMNLSITGAAALTGGGSIPIPLPPIVLTDLGKEKNGVTLVEAVREILDAIAGVAGTAVAGAGNLLGEGASALGSGATEAGKALAGTATDAGKALGGAAADAGKAVGDALKNINPFGK